MEPSIIAGLVLIGCAFVLIFLPVAECDQCPHCRNERLEAQRRSEESKHRAVHRFYGERLCPICNERKDR